MPRPDGGEVDRAIALEVEAKLLEERRKKQCIRDEIRNWQAMMGIRSGIGGEVVTEEEVSEMLDIADKCQKRAEVLGMIDKMDRNEKEIEQLKKLSRTV